MTVIFFDVPLINHNDEDEKLWRLAKWMCLFAEKINTPVKDLKNILWNLEDHKGLLIAIFQKKPDAMWLKAAQDSWEECDEYSTQFRYVKTSYEIFDVEALNG